MNIIIKYLPLIMILFWSCTSVEKSDEKGLESTKKDQINEVLLNQINNDLKKFDYTKVDSVTQSIYVSNNFKNVWFDNQGDLSSECQDFITLLNNAKSYGLNETLYLTAELQQQIQYVNNGESEIANFALADVMLTKTYVVFAKHLNHGLIANHKFFTELETKNDTIDFSKVVIKGHLISNLLALQPQHQEYIKLQKALAKFVAENTISDTIISIPNFKKDSVKSYEITKQVLVKLKYLTSDAQGETIVEGVKKFQADNGLTPDGLIGKHTVEMLEYSTSKIYFQAAITLEKWRWIEDWGPNYFFANIPEFQFKVYENGELIINNRTVVGTSYTPTPEIDSKLKYFIVNPEWNVPYSITSGELIPKMKKDPTYLERNNYAISTNGVSINDIDWANANPATFNYKIKQKSGSSNALGKVKFIFDNKHSVYFHDTPSKSFFNKDIRSYSHGCVRLQNPFDIAEYVIAKENNENWVNLLDTVKAKKITKTFTPQGDYPIHIGYFTSVGDSAAHLKTLIDIYQKNDTLVSRFKEAFYKATN